MSASNILRWSAGNGWLVLSGGDDPGGEVRAQTLRRLPVDGGVAYIGLDADDAETVMDDLAELGAPTGYLVNILTEDDDTIRARLQEAALIVIPGDLLLENLLSGLLGAGVDGMRAALERGAVILAEATSAILFGRFIPLASGEMIPGLNWLEDVFIMPGVTSLVESEMARAVLTSHDVQAGIGLGWGSALALGPGGAVEVLGKGEVTVALGGQVT